MPWVQGIGAPIEDSDSLCHREQSPTPVCTGCKKRADARAPMVGSSAAVKHSAGVPARRPVSRVLSRRPVARATEMAIHLGRRSPGGSSGRPEGWAARLSPRRTGVAPSYLALLRVEFAAFHSVPTGRGPPGRHRHCGTVPRLSADGRYPLPCAAELGLSSSRGGRSRSRRAAIRSPRRRSILPPACADPEHAACRAAPPRPLRDPDATPTTPRAARRPTPAHPPAPDRSPRCTAHRRRSSPPAGRGPPTTDRGSGGARAPRRGAGRACGP